VFSCYIAGQQNPNTTVIALSQCPSVLKRAPGPSYRPPMQMSRQMQHAAAAPPDPHNTQQSRAKHIHSHAKAGASAHSVWPRPFPRSWLAVAGHSHAPQTPSGTAAQQLGARRPLLPLQEASGTGMLATPTRHEPCAAASAPASAPASQHASTPRYAAGSQARPGRARPRVTLRSSLLLLHLVLLADGLHGACAGVAGVEVEGRVLAHRGVVAPSGLGSGGHGRVSVLRRWLGSVVHVLQGEAHVSE
jgi:hypothetical protein